jgi:hypothetical protein
MILVITTTFCDRPQNATIPSSHELLKIPDEEICHIPSRVSVTGVLVFMRKA